MIPPVVVHWSTWGNAMSDAFWTAKRLRRRFRVSRANDGCWQVTPA